MSSAAALENQRLDLQELRELRASSQRPRVQDLLDLQIRRIETDLAAAAEAAGGDQPAGKSAGSAASQSDRSFTTEIKTYAWDDSDKFCKLYVSEGLSGVGSLDKDAVTAEFTENSVLLRVRGLNGRDRELRIPRLYDRILPDSCSFKVKSDQVLLSLRKAACNRPEKPFTEHASARRRSEAKIGGQQQEGAGRLTKDPSASMMGLMRQMYEEGDDEMKRTIAKAFSESQSKRGAGAIRDFELQGRWSSDRQLDKRKRKAAYRRQAALAAKRPRGGRQQLLTAGWRGLLVTCNKRERECVGEALDLLDTFLPDDPAEDNEGAEEDADDGDNAEDDIQRCLERERARGGGLGLRAAAAQPCEHLPTKASVPNCVFVGVSLPDSRLPWLFDVTDAVFEAAVAAAARATGSRGVGGRHILRLLPVEATCASGLQDIGEAFESLWTAFVAADRVTDAPPPTLWQQPLRPTFTVHFKARNFDKLERQDVINRVFNRCEICPVPDWSVDHDRASVVIDVNVLQRVTCLSLLRNFRRYASTTSARWSRTSAGTEAATTDAASLGRRCGGGWQD
uniref:Calcyclin-binding protein n=1 Tax=Macrostomum lignano TaxID=282301 RepID=A0A1I8IF87_9PLAT